VECPFQKKTLLETLIGQKVRILLHTDNSMIHVHFYKKGLGYSIITDVGEDVFLAEYYLKIGQLQQENSKYYSIAHITGIDRDLFL